MAGVSTIIIGCGIFRKEIEFLIKEKGLSEDVIFLDAALHVNFDKLKVRLTDALEECREKGGRVKILYGHCHPEMNEILGRYGAKRIEAGNCLEAIAGAEEIARLDKEAKTFFLTSGWVNNWEAMFRLGEEDFNFDFRRMFSSYKRIVVFDISGIPVDEEKVRKLSDYARLPVERRSITLDNFLQILNAC
ncbi:MAG: DUF1638 domain-containing protein [Candidatus Sulfobium sp.]